MGSHLLSIVRLCLQSGGGLFYGRACSDSTKRLAPPPSCATNVAWVSHAMSGHANATRSWGPAPPSSNERAHSWNASRDSIICQAVLPPSPSLLSALSEATWFLQPLYRLLTKHGTMVGVKKGSKVVKPDVKADKMSKLKVRHLLCVQRMSRRASAWVHRNAAPTCASTFNMFILCACRCLRMLSYAWRGLCSAQLSRRHSWRQHVHTCMPTPCSIVS